MFNLGIGLLLSLFLWWHYKRFGRTLSNRDHLGQVFPFILLTTILVISVVKSSLALSLGLVGALSIVRFRTPIKEPEELAYLFLSIAIGLGLGANQTVATVITGSLILIIMGFIGRARASSTSKHIHLTLDWQGSSGKSADNYLEEFNALIPQHAPECHLKRFDLQGDSGEIIYTLNVEDQEKLHALIKDIRKSFPKTNINFIDQKELVLP